MAGVALRLPGWTSALPAEIEDGPISFDGERGRQRGAAVENLPPFVDPVRQFFKSATHLLGRQSPQGVHVLDHVVESDGSGKPNESFTPSCDGGEHGPQVGQVVGEHPRWVKPRGQELFDTVPPRRSPFDQQRRRDDHPLLGEILRIWRDRTRPNAADLGMVRAASNISEQALVGIHRRRQGHIREMGSSERRMIGHHNIAGSQGQVLGEQADTQSHGAEVNRDVRRIDDQPTLGIEQGAGEILTFLDVGGDGRSLEHLTHFTGDAGKAVAHEFELHRARCLVPGSGNGLIFVGSHRPDRNPAVSESVDPPPGRNDQRAVRLVDEGRTIDHHAELELRGVVARHLAPLAIEETPLPGHRIWGLGRDGSRRLSRPVISSRRPRITTRRETTSMSRSEGR